MLDLALFQPDIAGNVGAMIRTAACLGAGVHIIEPAGFTWDQRSLHRAAMDYLDGTTVTRHADWTAFLAAQRGAGRRLVLLSAHANDHHDAFAWRRGDVLLLGSEGAGVPPAVAAACDRAVTIAMRPGRRSLNVGVAAGIALAEARRVIARHEMGEGPAA